MCFARMDVFMVFSIDGLLQKGYVIITPLLDPERFLPESLARH